MRKSRKEYQDKSIVELEKQAQTIREEIAKLSIESKLKPQKDTNLIVKKRKSLAVVLTLINEKKALELLQQQ